MRLNDIKPAAGSRPVRTRVGRGIGSGLGKTCGRGHKGQRARAGGYHKVGFEGGQMPYQRRLPKVGFVAISMPTTAEVPVSALAKLAGGGTIDIAALKAAHIVPQASARVKVILSGTLDKAVIVSAEVSCSRGARAAIEAAGGRIEG